MKRIILVFSILVIMVSNGCHPESLIPKEEVDFLKTYVELHQKRKFEDIERSISPDIKDNNIRVKLEEIADFIPNDIPKNINVVGSHTVTYENTVKYNLTLQYEFPTKWILVNIHLKKNLGKLLVEGFNVQPMSDSLENINKFTWQGKKTTNYIILIMAVLVPLFIVFALILCIRTAIPKRKYLWIIFILLGFCRITLDWTTGNIGINPLTFNLLGSGFLKASQYAPVFIYVSFPLGAVMFLLKRKKWLKKNDPN